MAEDGPSGRDMMAAAEPSARTVTEGLAPAGPRAIAIAGGVPMAGPSGEVSSSFILSPKEVIPLPKENSMRKRQNRKFGKTTILTSSPFKKYLVKT